MANHQIQLNVNTTAIPYPATTEQTDANCSFQGQTNGVTNELFNVDVNNGDSVTWIGVSSSAPTTDTVSITEIDYESGTNVFGSNDLTPESGASTISGTVSNAHDADVETYTIKFAVYKNGVLHGNYQIDPKITVSASNR